MSGEQAFITRFNFQRCVGYNADYTTTYWEGEALFSDGTTKAIHAIERQINIVSRSALVWKIGPLREFVAQPMDN